MSGLEKYSLKLSPNRRNVLQHFLCSRELLVKFADNQRNYVTQFEKKGTICPPLVKTSYVEVYFCPLIPEDVAFLGK